MRGFSGCFFHSCKPALKFISSAAAAVVSLAYLLLSRRKQVAGKTLPGLPALSLLLQALGEAGGGLKQRPNGPHC